MDRMLWLAGLLCLALFSSGVAAADAEAAADVAPDTVEDNLGAHKDGSRTDTEALSR